MRAIAVGVVSIAALSIGCAPMIAHGPDVHPGLSGGVSVATGHGPRYENGDDPGPLYWGAVVASTAYGIRPTSDARPAFRFGMQLPTQGKAGLDMFAQLPRKWLRPFSGGAGILADFSGGRQMPYAQLGVKNGKGYGVNVATGRYSYRNRGVIGYDTDERVQVNWLNFEVPMTRIATVHLHAGYASGHVTTAFARTTPPYVGEHRWVKLGGITLEWHHPGLSPMQANAR